MGTPAPGPDEHSPRARGGGGDIRRWARVASLIGAVLALIGWALGTLRAGGSEVPGTAGLDYLAAMAAPFLVVGAGLAVAATVEARRAPGGAGGAATHALRLTWILLILGVCALLLSSP